MIKHVIWGGALVLIALLVAGCGSTRIVHVKDPRAKITNQSLPSKVLANFAGKPRSTPPSPWPGFDCQMYGSPYKVVAGPGPAFILEVCVREPAS